MATVKFGAIVTDMRGKLGGHVFQKGNQSRVLKTNAIPRKGITATSEVSQALIDTVRNAYNALSESQKNAWRIASTDQFKINQFGDRLAYTGRQYFLYRNVNQLRQYDDMTLNAGELGFVISPATVESFVINTGTGQIISSGSGAGGVTNVGWYGKRVSQGTQTLTTNGLVWFGRSSNPNPTTAVLYDALEALTGTITTGDKFIIGYKSINTTGLSSSMTPMFVIAS